MKMALPGYCSECSKPLEGKPPSTKTCSTSCRSKRSRRLKRQQRHAGQIHADPRHDEIRAAINTAELDVAHEVMKEELRPIVRDAMTEDALRAIQSMVGLTPLAVAAIEEDLICGDPTIRQRAYTLLMKYTVGHQAIIRPEDEISGQMVVNFNLPRPGDEIESQGAAVELVAEELRNCDMCGKDKSVTQFVAGSDRCLTCYDEQREFAQKLLDRNAAG